MGFKAIKKNTAVNMVIEQILQQINDRVLVPGGKLPAQRELAVMLGVGRSSIREAVNALVAKGYLEPVQGKGTFITDCLPGTEQQLEKLSSVAQKSSLFDLVEARAVLECKTASLAAQRITKKELDRLTKILLELSHVDPHAEYNVFLEADMAFHYALAEATHNQIICEMTKFVLQLLGEHHEKIRASELSTAYRQRSVDTLEKVLDAIARQSPDDAASWMQVHLSAIKTEVDGVI